MVDFLVGGLALLVGATFCFAGYRLFLILMPAWGFLVGFALGSSGVSALFGEAFLATLTSWIVGAVVGIAFALLAYFWYWAAIVILCGSIGYAVGAGIFTGIGSSGVVAFVIGTVFAVIAVVVAISLHVPQFLVVCFTAFNGASAMVAGLLLWFGKLAVSDLSQGAVAGVIHASWVWLFVYLVVALLGVAAQLATSRNYSLERTAYQL